MCKDPEILEKTCKTFTGKSPRMEHMTEVLGDPEVVIVVAVKLVVPTELIVVTRVLVKSGYPIVTRVGNCVITIGVAVNA